MTSLVNDVVPRSLDHDVNKRSRITKKYIQFVFDLRIVNLTHRKHTKVTEIRTVKSARLELLNMAVNNVQYSFLLCQTVTVHTLMYEIMVMME